MIYRAYDTIISLESLLEGWQEFRKGKRKKPDVMLFERYLEDNLFCLHEELRSQTYQHDPYYTFHIQDPKHRVISKATVRDRLVHHVVTSELNRVFDPAFIYHSYASRLERGTHRAVENVARALRAVSRNYTQPAYALKCDIKRFFDSVDHGVLLRLIRAKISDERFFRLIRHIIMSFAVPVDNFEQRERVRREFYNIGLPIGNVTSQIFANIYLNELDQYVKHALKVRHYFRYADDFLIIHRDPVYLRQLLLAIQVFLADRLCLQLHPRKVEIRKFSHGIDFLGYVLLPHHHVLRTKTKRRMFKKLTFKQELLAAGVIELEQFHQSVQSYRGLVKHVNGYGLDQMVQNMFQG